MMLLILNIHLSPHPHVAIPLISSFGIMDSYLPSTYSIPNRLHGEDVVRISNPLFGVRNPYPPADFSFAVHAYTWQGILRLTFSYPEAHMGLPQELQAGKHGSVESKGSVVDYAEEFMNILDIIIKANDETEDSSRNIA